LAAVETSAPLSRKPASCWPVVAALVILAASLASQFWFPRIDSSPFNDTWNVDLGGRNALFQFAQRRWGNVSRNILPLNRSLDRMQAPSALCLLGPARPPSDSEWNALLSWVRQGGHLLVAPSWSEPELKISQLGLSVVSTETSGPFTKLSPVLNPSPKAGPQADPGPGLNPVTVPALPVSPTTSSPENPPAKQVSPDLMQLTGVDWQSRGKILAGPEAAVLFRTAEGVQGVEIPLGGGRIVVLATDHVFSNRSLSSRMNPRNGVLAVQLLQRVAGTDTRLVFDESLNASGQPQVVGVLFNHWLRPATLQVATLLWLFAWAGAGRFGVPRPSPKPPRHSLVEHTNALGNLHWRSGNGLAPLQAYFESLLAELRLGRHGELLPRRISQLADSSGLTPDQIERRIELAIEAVNRRAVVARDAGDLIRLLSELRPHPQPPVASGHEAGAVGPRA
jgi:hypothetical protein